MAANATKVLLVDDNPLILDLMRRGIEPHAEVITCTGATDALLQCTKGTPDLVISDYRMPGLDGIHLLRTLKAEASTQSVRVILVATKSDIDEKLRSLSDLAEDFIVKPFFVHELSSKVKKVLERIYWEKMQKQAPQQGVISGRLAEMNIIDLLQSLELGQKTCSLTITHNGEDCRMFFSEGQLHHAELGAVAGDEAVYEAVGWTDGSFEINFNTRCDKRTTTQSTQGLLMEGLRLLDERKHESSG